jgi:hypothetical protein
MSGQKILENYCEVSITISGNRNCHKCGEKISKEMPYLHLRRNRHIFVVCGKCLVFFTQKALEYNY